MNNSILTQTVKRNQKYEYVKLSRAMFTVWLSAAHSIDRPICQRRAVSGRPYQRFARNMADGGLLYCTLAYCLWSTEWNAAGYLLGR